MANQDHSTDPPAIGPTDTPASLPNRPAPSGTSDIALRLGQSIERQMLGTRLSGLAQGMVDLLDRAVADRIDDARRWAAEPVVAACLTGPATVAAAATTRLTRLIADRPLYLDLWIANADGIVVATGRPDRHPGLTGIDVATQPWFRAALASGPGVVATAEIAAEPRLGGATALPFAAAIPSADPTAPPLGLLVLFFDWDGQSAQLLRRARQRGGEIGVRCLLLDRADRVIAASGPSEDAGETFALPTPLAPAGWFADRHGILFGYARSTDRPDCPGLGWSGVVARRPDGDDPIH
ncbi:cache domain-containing protein [Magnetospirillum fulvum]|uniref:Methyl-accepting chemotaxis protein n=1 Tax=Magnetospirillum fulvum TaxID=1082 RepID=A0A1H6H950_MAGFU|nr:cache domain-containing protein [Magnetospirillum fulvum]SEH32311.1 hypothetical protein SAMN04244559_01221 [Magnetospirillum fulvum]